MNYSVSLLLVILPLFIFGQNDRLNNDLWCFEQHFMDSIAVNDTLEVTVFAFDNSPIAFKKNGKFRRIAAPVTMCGNNRKENTKIDHLTGTWSLNEHVLSMITDTKTIEFQLIEQTQHTLVLKVVSMNSKMPRQQKATHRQ